MSAVARMAGAAAGGGKTETLRRDAERRPTGPVTDVEYGGPKCESWCGKNLIPESAAGAAHWFARSPVERQEAYCTAACLERATLARLMRNLPLPGEASAPTPVKREPMAPLIIIDETAKFTEKQWKFVAQIPMPASGILASRGMRRR
jgi:hypothetical protein